METITPQAIKDFLVCPLFFEYRYVQKLQEKEQENEIYKERYINTLRRVASYFFYRRQAGKPVGFDGLIKRWEKNWFPKGMSYKDIAFGESSVRSDIGHLVKGNSTAIAAIERFYNVFSADAGVPVLIDERRTFQATNNIRLTTSIDLMLKYQDGTRYVVKWLVGKPKFGAHFLTLDLAATHLALKATGSYRDDTYYAVYDFSKPRARLEPFEVSGEDVAFLLNWVRQLDQRGTPIPRRGFTPYCGTCPFDSQCESYVRNMVQ